MRRISAGPAGFGHVSDGEDDTESEELDSEVVHHGADDAISLLLVQERRGEKKSQQTRPMDAQPCLIIHRATELTSGMEEHETMMLNATLTLNPKPSQCK